MYPIFVRLGGFFSLFLRKKVKNAPNFCTLGAFLKTIFCKKHPTFVLWVFFYKKDNLKNTTDRPTQIFRNSTWGQHNNFLFLAGPHLSTYKVYQY